jgi:hypothetical protein
MAKFKIQKSATVNVGFDSTATIGGTGGLTDTTGNQVQAKTYVTGGTQGANGSILRAKGRGKFLVTDASLIQDEDIVAGNYYIITSVSNTDWQALGAPAGASVGTIFKAGKSGSGLTTDGVVNLIGVCTLVNKAAGSLAAGEMSIQATTSAPANYYVARLTNKFVINFSGVKSQWKFGAATADAVSIPGA